MVDLFEEVEEELRTEQLKRTAAKLAPYVIGGLLVGLVLMIGVLVFTKIQGDAQGKASQTYQTALDKRDGGDLKAAFDDFGQIAKSGPKTYKVLALMQQGAIRLNENNVKAAVALFDEAAKTAPGGKAGDLLADNARLKSALALMDEAPYAEVEGRLKPLMDEGRPYRGMAREALAMAKLNAGKVKEARDDFSALTLSIDAPEATTERARQALALIDSGAAASIPETVKAAKNVVLPQPNRNIDPRLLQQLIEQQQQQQKQQGAAQ